MDGTVVRQIESYMLPVRIYVPTITVYATVQPVKIA